MIKNGTFKVKHFSKNNISVKLDKMHAFNAGFQLFNAIEVLIQKRTPVSFTEIVRNYAFIPPLDLATKADILDVFLADVVNWNNGDIFSQLEVEEILDKFVDELQLL